MTNQQGAPEALHCALIAAAKAVVDRWDTPLWKDAPATAEYIGRLRAVLVEAQQPAAHVQNPAEIEHVAGDVSKNGPESNMAQQAACGNTPYDEGPFTLAQQPAPSAAGAGKWSLGEIDGNWRDIDLPDHGGVMRIVWRMEDDEGRNEELEAQAHAVIEALNTPQPSPTPQADSQPAPANTRQIAECYGDCPTDPKTCANPCKFDGRAARAPADSVTAPAGGAVAEASMREDFEAYWRSKYAPLPMNTRLRDDGRYGDPTIQQECESWRVTHTPTPPAQAADSVLEDAVGLINDIDTHMRSEWSAGRLPAACWPLAFSDRIKTILAARKQGGA